MKTLAQKAFLKAQTEEAHKASSIVSDKKFRTMSDISTTIEIFLISFAEPFY